MSILIHEIRKIFDWRLLLVIAAATALIWFAGMRDALNDYNSLTRYGAFGSYQTEMFNLFGDTLEPEEIIAFDFPGRFAEIYAEANILIAANPVFAEYGISTFEEYHEWLSSDNLQFLPSGVYTDEEQAIYDDMIIMGNAFDQYGGSSATIEEWYAGLMNRWLSLTALENQYIYYHTLLESYTKHDTRPVVVRVAQALLENGNNSLIQYHLTTDFSLYAAITGLFVVIAVIILVMPLVTIDNSRTVNYIQYSSVTGRKVLRIQLAATIVSAFVLSAFLAFLFFAPFLAVAGKYWNAGIMTTGIRGLWLYDVTFGQYVIILACMMIALSVAAACVAFILARYSMSLVMVMIKAVPAAAIFSAIAAVAMNMALSANNIVFNQIFRGRLDIPEVILCVVILLICVIPAIFIAANEKGRNLV